MATAVGTTAGLGSGSTAVGTGTGTSAEPAGASGTVGSSPSQRGLRQMITAMPHAVTSRSIVMNAMSFCFADGPRGRTTSVGVLPSRALRAPGGTGGRSGMRIVGCAAPRGAFIGEAA